jgi:elongator complex protein 1
VQGNHFSEARRIVSFSPALLGVDFDSLLVVKATLHSSPELVTDIIHPAAMESCAQLAEDIDEMREQLRRQLRRIRELRIKKAEAPGKS